VTNRRTVENQQKPPSSGEEKQEETKLFPVRTDTIAGCIYYLFDSQMLRDFEGLSTKDQKERDRLVSGMNKWYWFGPGPGPVPAGGDGGSAPSSEGLVAVPASRQGDRETVTTNTSAPTEGRKRMIVDYYTGGSVEMLGGKHNFFF